MVPVQYRCINLSEITRGHPLAIWDVIGKPHVYLWTHVSMLLPFDKQMEFPSQPCWMIINSCSYMHRAKQRPPVTSGWAVAKAVLWRTSYDIFQDPQTKMTGDCDMSTASSKKKTSCGWQMLKKCVKIFACKHHANDTSRHPCAFETKPRNTGNADRAGRASSALALADAVVTDAVLVDDFVVVDLGLLILVDGFVVDVDSVLVDTLVVDRVLVLVDTVWWSCWLFVACAGAGWYCPWCCPGRCRRWRCPAGSWGTGLSKVEGIPADLSTGLGPAFICFPPVEMSMNPIFACGAHAFYCGHNVWSHLPFVLAE